jgi:hypothetical protein
VAAETSEGPENRFDPGSTAEGVPPPHLPMAKMTIANITSNPQPPWSAC